MVCGTKRDDSEHDDEPMRVCLLVNRDTHEIEIYFPTDVGNLYLTLDAAKSFLAAFTQMVVALEHLESL